MRKLFDEEKIISLYKDGNSIRNIKKILHIDTATIAKILRKNNIEIISRLDQITKYEMDEKYFDIIDDENKAYILGFLYADGYNYEKGYMINLSLQDEDKEILEKIRDLISKDKPLRYHTYTNGYNRKPQYSLVFNNVHMSKRLAELGVVQNKTFKLEFPTFLREDLVRHFIRGYFDGDGCITRSLDKEFHFFKYNISIVSTEKLLMSIQEIFETELGIKKSKLITRHPERSHNIRSLHIGGNNQVEKLLNYMYKDSTIYLKRKYDKYLIFLDRKNNSIIKEFKTFNNFFNE